MRASVTSGLQMDPVFWTTSGVGSEGVELRADSAVSVASMAVAGDFYRGLVPLIEEDAVVATAETKAGFRRFEFFHIAGALDR